MRILIPFLLAIAIHVIGFALGNIFYKPPEVHFKPGESAVQLKLVASIQSPEQEKMVKDQNDASPDEPETFVKKEIQKPPEPVIKTEETGITKHQEMKQNIQTEGHALSEQNESSRDVSENTAQINQKTSVETHKQTEENEIRKDEIAKQKTIPDPVAQARKDTVPSKEVIADTLTKGIQNPSIMDVKKPRYPNSCRKKGCEGVCVLRVFISKEGKCTDIQIVKSTGCSKLDNSAIKSLKKARFTPAERFGVKVNGAKEIAFRFKIKNLEE